MCKLMHLYHFLSVWNLKIIFKTIFFIRIRLQVEQMLCARNYDSWMTSAVSVAFLVPGFVGGGIQGPDSIGKKSPEKSPEKTT